MATVKNLGVMQYGLMLEDHNFTSNLKKAEKGVKDFDKQAKGFSSTARNMRFAAGQASFQVADIAVQLQSGTNALVVFAQQGSQIAGIFGPTGAMVGAVIAVGAAIGSALLPTLFDTKKGVDILKASIDQLNKSVTRSDGIVKFTDDLKLLAAQSTLAAEAGLARSIALTMRAIESAAEGAAKQVEELAGSFNPFSKGDAFFGNVRDILEPLKGTTDEVFALTHALQDLSKEPSEEHLTSLTTVLDKLIIKYGNGSKELLALNDSLTQYNASLIRNKATLEDLQALSGDLPNLLEKLLGDEDGIAGISEVERRLADLRKEFSQLGKTPFEIRVEETLEGVTDPVKREELQVELDKINAYNTQRKILEDIAKHDAKMAKEAQRREKERANAVSKAEKDLANVKTFLLSEEEAIAESYNKRIKLVEDGEKILGEKQAEVIKDLQEKRDEAVAEHQRNAIKEVLSTTAQSFETFTGMLEQFGQDQSGAYKAMFAATKAFAIAEAAVSIEGAIGKASNFGIFPQNLAAMATVAANTAGIIANIKAIEMGGAAHGGLTNVPSEATYLLNKGERVLSPNQNSDLNSFMKTGSGVNVNIYNAPAGAEVKRDGNNIDVLFKKVEGALIQNVQQGRGLAKHLTRKREGTI